MLYSFGPLPDAEYPGGGLLAGKRGEYYGTATSGGSSGNCKPGCGAVYEITAGAKEKVLYSFEGAPDGANPGSSLIMDKDGALYGVTSIGGGGGSSCGYTDGCGTVFKLSPSEPGWTEKVLYAFQGGADGIAPVGGLVMSKSGALLGTTLGGGSNKRGIVFELTPSGSTYSETVIHTFPQGSDDGIYPTNGLVSDISGNLYGTTSSGGLTCGCGTVFKLTPKGSTYSYSVIYRFRGGTDGAQPSVVS